MFKAASLVSMLITNTTFLGATGPLLEIK